MGIYFKGNIEFETKQFFKEKTLEIKSKAY